MKNLVFILVVASLWGCGPQQTSTERDQQQIQAEYQRVQSKYKPFAGTYVGTGTVLGSTKEISLHLEPANEADSDVSRLQQTPVPSLRGQLLECLTDASCFSVNPVDQTYTNNIAITKAVYNPSDDSKMEIFSSGGSAGSTCVPGTDCTPYIYKLSLSQDHNTVTGTIYVGTRPVGPLNLTRVQ